MNGNNKKGDVFHGKHIAFCIKVIGIFKSGFKRIEKTLCLLL